MLPRGLRRAAGTVIPLSVLLTLVVAAPVAANPPGNNGTIKIDGVEWDNHPNNEPHVGCTFEVDFYGFDAGDYWADVTFEAHPPTGHGVLDTDSVFIGHDDNGGGGSEAGWDASAQYDLTQTLAGYPVHPQQGYHVKLTIAADGFLHGQGPKHKVFWVGPCDSETPPSKPPSNSPGGGTAPARGAVAAGSPSVTVLPDTAMSAASTWGLLMAGVVLLSGATLATVQARRTRSRRR